jgi:hypothetical protein
MEVAEHPIAHRPSPWRGCLALGGLGLLGLALLLAGLVAGVRADAIEPALGSISLGQVSLNATIENRICLQRVLKRACRPPTYWLRLRLDGGGPARYYDLLSLPLSERYAFYP